MQCRRRPRTTKLYPLITILGMPGITSVTTVPLTGALRRQAAALAS